MVAERYGWFLGLLSFCASRIPSLAARAATTAMLALTVAAGSLTGQCASAPLDAAQMLARMEQYHASQREGMASYQSTRRYVAGNTRLGVRAEVTAAMSYRAPGEKTLTLLSRSGSRSVQKTVIEPAMAAETSAVTARNSAFRGRSLTVAVLCRSAHRTASVSERRTFSHGHGTSRHRSGSSEPDWVRDKNVGRP